MILIVFLMEKKWVCIFVGAVMFNNCWCIVFLEIVLFVIKIKLVFKELFYCVVI